ncbi:hypothetical protein Ddye_027095 [Dipteronia dyeriana]|uniref:Reverse transcriptase n=1 Tax=Dipteronia dyeriana TaxID=168575 RepID=A0AAD9WR55_9ROSI|nr:hypothetical protein Ddye_027095 [Dipteronia dyeriana]
MNNGCMEGIEDGSRDKVVSGSVSKEVAKIIKMGVALGLDFNGKETLVSKELARNEREDEARDLGRMEKRRVVRNLVLRIRPIFLFIQESKLNYFDYIVIKALGGVLSKIRKEVVLCNLYAATLKSERVKLWNFILSAQVSLPGTWIIGGEFNTVFEPCERKCRFSSVSSMRNFKAFSNAANVVDTLMQGMAFTWSNSREYESWARLNHLLCNPLFLSWFPKLSQKGLSRSLTDHNPIVTGEPCLN